MHDASFVEEGFSGKDGVRIFLRTWTSSTPRGVIVICHGVNAHGGQYLWPDAHFAEQDFAVFALDLRGRGRSEGERFYVEDVADYVSDVADTIRLAKTRHPGLPVFLLGHSAGGVTSASYVLDHQGELAGFICESFAFRVFAPGFVLSLVKALSHVAPHLGVLKLNNADFSRDPAWVAALNADPYTQNEKQPVATVAALTRANERLEKAFPTVTLPLLILHGTADKATNCKGSEFFFETAGAADKTLKLYEGHVHDLLADFGKEEVIADILHWIEARLPVARPASGDGAQQAFE